MTTLAPLCLIPAPILEPFEAGAIEQCVEPQSIDPTLPLKFEDDGFCEAFFGPQPTSTSLLPDPVQFAKQLAQTVFEISIGRRAVQQVAKWVSHEVYQLITRRARVAAQLRPQNPLPRASNGVRTMVPVIVKKVRTCHLADGVVEACAIVFCQGQVRALAIRLEGQDNRWRATAIEFV